MYEHFQNIGHVLVSFKVTIIFLNNVADVKGQNVFWLFYVEII